MDAPRRYASVDAMRGLTVAAMLLVNNPGDWGHVYAPLLHAPWHGCTPTDLVFPFFLFVVGVSIALGIVPRAEAGADLAGLRRGVLWRALKIIAIGAALHLLAMWLFERPAYRLWGVLQRIGVVFACSGLLVLALRARGQWWMVAALLVGYWALMAAGGSYEPYANLANRIDSVLYGPLLYRFDAATGQGMEPEGLLSTLPAIATCLLGVRAGDWLRQGRVRAMALAVPVLLAMGAAWSAWFPLNKPLWTSSYVLWTAGWALLVLLLMHLAIDRRGLPAIGRSFGVNAITAYAGAGAVVYVLLASGAWKAGYQLLVAGWMTPLLGAHAASLAWALAWVGLWWLVMRWMDRRGWHLKV